MDATEEVVELGLIDYQYQGRVVYKARAERHRGGEWVAAVALVVGPSGELASEWIRFAPSNKYYSATLDTAVERGRVLGLWM